MWASHRARPLQPTAAPSAGCGLTPSHRAAPPCHGLTRLSHSPALSLLLGFSIELSERILMVLSADKSPQNISNTGGVSSLSR